MIIFVTGQTYVIVGYVMSVIGKDSRMNPDYDPDKYDMDEYGNLIPKEHEEEK